MRTFLTSLAVGLTFSVLALSSIAPAHGTDVTWTQVGTGITQGISGITADPTGGWVVVRDNKSTGQNRVALVGADNTVTPLTWPGTAPQDLEAIDALPGQPGRYAVVTSGGSGRVISLSGTTLSVVRSFTLPRGRNQNEGFALVPIGSSTVALWGNRGSTTTPGRLYAATFNLSQGTFGAVVSGAVTVPYPTDAVRHISDTEVVANRVVVSAASDNGDNGPFSSAVYDVGSVTMSGGRARLSLAAPVQLGAYADHKIEGIACAGSTGILGTDDENLGGWVAPADFCG